MGGPDLRNLVWPWESHPALGAGKTWTLGFSLAPRALWLLLLVSVHRCLLTHPFLQSDLSFPLLLFQGSLPCKPLTWCRTLPWRQHPPFALLCGRVKCLCLLLGTGERCCIAEPCCVGERYVLEAAFLNASWNVSVLLLTSVASSCPPSVVLAAEDAGDSLFAERGGWWRIRSSNSSALLEQHVVSKAVVHHH